MRTYQEMPPLWYVQERLALSDKYPSGLEWTENTGWHGEGEMAGKYNKHTGHYIIYLGGTPYVAHRLVHYLRTEKDPGNADVKHERNNLDKDNRKELTLYYRKSQKTVKRSYVKSGLYSKNHSLN